MIGMTLGYLTSHVREKMGRSGATRFAEDDEAFGAITPHFTDAYAKFAIASAATNARQEPAIALNGKARHDLPVTCAGRRPFAGSN
jgi:hypothetical protein